MSARTPMTIYPAHRENARLGSLTWRAVPKPGMRFGGIVATSKCDG